MNYTNEIMPYFELLTGMDSAAAMQWIPVCEAAEQYVFARIKQDADINRNLPRICLAIAGVCLCRYRGLQHGNEFKLGDFSTKSSAGEQNDESYLEGIKDLLIAENFAFVAVSEKDNSHADCH